ncbi:MAG: hypothetical protein GY751_06225, partial [Bacteroidetes bacterium]|nr:hypothetical protein [Bacteroidota bacterium]
MPYVKILYLVRIPAQTCHFKFFLKNQNVEKSHGSEKDIPPVPAEAPFPIPRGLPLRGIIQLPAAQGPHSSKHCPDLSFHIREYARYAVQFAAVQAAQVVESVQGKVKGVGVVADSGEEVFYVFGFEMVDVHEVRSFFCGFSPGFFWEGINVLTEAEGSGLLLCGSCG